MRALLFLILIKFDAAQLELYLVRRQQTSESACSISTLVNASCNIFLNPIAELVELQSEGLSRLGLGDISLGSSIHLIRVFLFEFFHEKVWLVEDLRNN